MDIGDFGTDHNLDHLQVWTTWELWTLQHKKARFSGKKARKSTQKEAKNRCFCVWELDATGSSPVTSTKQTERGQNPLFVCLVDLAADESLLHRACAMCEFESCHFDQNRGFDRSCSRRGNSAADFIIPIKQKEIYLNERHFERNLV